VSVEFAPSELFGADASHKRVSDDFAAHRCGCVAAGQTALLAKCGRAGDAVLAFQLLAATRKAHIGVHMSTEMALQCVVKPAEEVVVVDYAVAFFVGGSLLSCEDAEGVFVQSAGEGGEDHLGLVDLAEEVQACVHQVRDEELGLLLSIRLSDQDTSQSEVLDLAEPISQHVRVNFSVWVNSVEQGTASACNACERSVLDLSEGESGKGRE